MSLLHRVVARRSLHRQYATVGSKTILGNPPKIPVPAPSIPQDGTQPLIPTSILNKHILSSLDGKATTLPSLIEQYTERHGRVLESSLSYESRPSEGRKLKFDEGVELGDGVVMVAHALRYRAEFKITVCSGFALNASNELSGSKGTLFLTCAHTFEEIRNSRLALDVLSNPFLSSSDTQHRSGSFIISGTPDAPVFHPVSSIASALHRSDLMILSASASTYTSTASRLNPSIYSSVHSLPVSPYPAPPGAAIRAHFVVDKKPAENGWKPWVGGTWSKWVKGKVLEYKDFAGREAQPGTYDSLSHLLFQPLPTPGSSGGPIIDEESGAVIGVMLGTRMDNRVAGVRGWGVPSETIFEMFSLPGLTLKNKF
ncbi:hypothetical protein BXZ70DRAFT_159668 [Cristinia sonorae]|uniref:Trypsin-like serine protease n=1 Tax=Cristinia sonorae TaxID=1940300 RepID=A0A8K0XPQ1_9AGAR|nr:hypothetical protein BXZ70DRAFT_159668 [Cristinia sonorae]